MPHHRTAPRVNCPTIEGTRLQQDGRNKTVAMVVVCGGLMLGDRRASGINDVLEREKERTAVGRVSCHLVSRSKMESIHLKGGQRGKDESLHLRLLS